MLTLITGLAFVLAFWKTVSILTRHEPVKKTYPSAVNQKLAMDYDVIKTI